MFHDDYPIAWTFHRNTSRWLYNALAPQESEGLIFPFKEYTDVPFFPLPTPLPIDVSLSEVIQRRASCRRFAATPFELNQLASLLQNSYGVLSATTLLESEFLQRGVPSGGGLYPLECYALVRNVVDCQPGTYHYQSLHHGLEQLNKATFPQSFVSDLFMHQPYVADAAVVLVLTAVLERTMGKYKDRGYRYMMFEAGHVAQNLCLLATGLGLGSLCLGGFFDIDLAKLLGLDVEVEVPLYCVAIGPTQDVPMTKLREVDGAF
jgi:SagB-type dehydrogenase family enzyme